MKPKDLAFGFKDEYMHMFGINNIGSIFHINKREQFAVTPKEIIKYERNQILKRFRFHFSIGCLIDTYNMVAFITEHNSNLCIFSLKDMSRPLVSNYPLNQTGIFHILYSPRSNCLITVGTGVRVWQVSLENSYQSSILDPTIKINLRSDFAYDKYETAILNPPSFDYNRELIFLPTSQGIKGFNLNGYMEISMSRLPAKSNTPIGYCQSNGKLITSDPHEGICLWDKDGKIKSTYTVCSSSILSLNFITPEHVLILNCQGAIFMLNLKTGRSYQIYTSPMIPNRLILQRDTAEVDPILVFIYNSRAVYKRIVIPWTLWTKNVIYPKLIRRVNKINEAARILVQTNNSFVKFFSPKNKNQLTSASSQASATPVMVMYDRGTFISVKKSEKDSNKKEYQICKTEKRDELFITMDNGIIYGFDTGFLPCQEVLKVDLKSTIITTCFDKEDDGTIKWMYAVASPKGEAFLCDYNSLKSKCKIMFGNFDVLNMLFHDKTGSLVLLFKNEIILINIKKHSVVARLSLNCKNISVSHLNDNFVYIGLETGQIMIVNIIDELTLQLNNDLTSQTIHTEAVTSFAFSQSFWVSTGMDGSVLFWEYSLNLIAKVILPEAIYACEVINGRRDLIVGTKSELMMIKGETIFDGEIDDEIEIIDNFDRKDDQLYSEIISLVEEEEEVEESLLSQRKAKNDDERKKNNKRRRKFPQKNGDQIINENDDDEKAALKKESAIAGMMKLNEDKKQNPAPPSKQEEPAKIEEEDENEEEEENGDVNDQNVLKKKKKKLRRKNEVKPEPSQADKESLHQKEKDDFLNDLFPKKKVLPPADPSIPLRPKRSRTEYTKRVRVARPCKHSKHAQQETQAEKEEDEHELRKSGENTSENEQQTANEEDADGDQIETEKVPNDHSIEKVDNEGSLAVVDKSLLKETRKEDVSTQGEIFTSEDEKASEKVEHLKPEPKENNKKEKQQKSATLRPKERKTEKKAKTSIAVKKQIDLKNPPKPSKSPQKVMQSYKAPMNKESPPRKNEDQRQKQKRSRTPPPKPQISPRKRSQPPPTAAPLKADESASIASPRKRPIFHDEGQVEKPCKVHEIDLSSHLIKPPDNGYIEEEGRRQVAANTRLYVLNLPQTNIPLSVVTHIDDPSWHVSDVTFCNESEKKCFFDEDEKSNRVSQFDEKEKNCSKKEDADGNDVFDDEDNDRLAEAVVRRCPGLIFTDAPKISSSSSAVLNLGQAIVPGAAWMRKTAVGSRLIKSIRPKVVAPIGKIEKSMKIRASGSGATPFFRTPLERIRMKGKMDFH
ncbi:hypothetical protein M9Y10_021134 [Tritrichomonas musculus]|uniref:Uncharacterized protein n=1 Tax=Tritrichomonas musculus TaxID=1915356 RepID=A0ABR2HD70_9EUKA